MSERPNPDYVDRCVDFISSGRRRCFADLALWAIIIGALFMVSSYGRNAPTGNRAWTERKAEYVEASALHDELDRSEPAFERPHRSSDFMKCLNS